MASKAVKKIAYEKKLWQLLHDHTQILVAAADNVGSKQLQNIRRRLKGGEFAILMGQNTMMKRSIRVHAEKTGNTAFLIQIPVLVGNVGLISSKGNLKEVSEEVAKYKIALDQKRVVHPPTQLAQQVKLQQYQLIEQLHHPLRRLWHLLL